MFEAKLGERPVVALANVRASNSNVSVQPATEIWSWQPELATAPKSRRYSGRLRTTAIGRKRPSKMELGLDVILRKYC